MWSDKDILCSLTCIATSIDSVSGQQRPRLDCANAQADQSLCCPQIAERSFSCVTHHECSLYMACILCLPYWGWSGEKVSCILMSPGHPIDVGLQLGKACFLVAGKGRGELFLFLLFLHFPSCSSLFPVLLFSLYYLFSPFLLEMTQNDPQGLMCH